MAKELTNLTNDSKGASETLKHNTDRQKYKESSFDPLKTLLAQTLRSKIWDTQPQNPARAVNV